MPKKPGVFIQYGVYHSKNKREKTKFKVLYELDIQDVEKELKPCLHKLTKTSVDRAFKG